MVSLPLVVFLSENSLVLFVALCGLLFCLHKIYPHPVLFYLVCGFGGAIAESIAIRYGSRTWSYVEPTNFLAVPIWLVPLWSIAGVFIVCVHNYLKK
jgi:hypothetical protein